MKKVKEKIDQGKKNINDEDPDLVVLAKGLCAGYSPLGALLAPNKIVEPVVSSGGFLHGHTYASNPLSCAIANAVLNEVVENNPERGEVKCKRHNGQIISVAYGDARLSLYVFLVLLSHTGHNNEALATVLRHISNMTPGRVENYGYTYNGRNLTRYSKVNAKIHLAIKHILKNYFRLYHIFAVRIGSCVKRLPDYGGARKTTFIHYERNEDPRSHYYKVRRQCNRYCGTHRFPKDKIHPMYRRYRKTWL